MKYATIIKDKEVTCSKICSITGEEYSLAVDVERYRLWKHGALIQNVFPELSIEQREFLISGWTPEEYADIFSDVEE